MDDKPRRRRMPLFGPRRKAPGGAEVAPEPVGDGVPEAGQDAPPVLSARMRAMLAAAPENGPDEDAADAPDGGTGRASAEEGRGPPPTAMPDEPAEDGGGAVPLRAARELRPAISEPEEPEQGPPAAAEAEEADPDGQGNRAISLAIRLGSMMGVVLAGVFVATLVDLALGLKTRFSGLGILATYLVVLAVILTPSLNPRTRRQWVMVIVGFAGVIFAIALGSAVARLMLMTKDFQHAGFYVHLAVEFGVMFAFWGLASLVFVEVLRGAGIKISGEAGDSS